jgi:hypothetical protein
VFAGIREKGAQKPKERRPQYTASAGKNQSKKAEKLQKYGGEGGMLESRFWLKT